MASRQAKLTRAAEVLLPPEHAQPRAKDVIRALADERGLNAGIDGERTRQAVDETDVDGQMLAALALGARIEEPFEEAEQRRCETSFARSVSSGRSGSIAAARMVGAPTITSRRATTKGVIPTARSPCVACAEPLR